MKYLYLFLIVGLFSSCASEQKVSEYGKEYKVSKTLSLFLNQFELATVNHNQEKIISLLDKAYKEKRCSNLSKDEKEFFFREFFCGKDVKTNQDVCPAFEEVVSINFVSILQNSDKTYTIRYVVHTILENLAAEWKITVKDNNGILIFGLKPEYS